MEIPSLLSGNFLNKFFSLIGHCSDMTSNILKGGESKEIKKNYRAESKNQTTLKSLLKQLALPDTRTIQKREVIPTYGTDVSS